MQQKSKALLTDIAIMRPILILSIVIGHAFAIFTYSKAWPLPNGCTQIDMLRWVNPVFISVALQAFVFVSGYLFAYKNNNASRIDILPFVFNKFKRIYLPSIIFSVIYIAIFGRENSNIWCQVYNVVNGAGHLWFLPMLFWCYTFGAIIYKYIKQPTWIILGLLLCLSVASIFVPNVLRISDAMHYFLYYAFGVYVFNCKEFLIDRVGKTRTLVPICFIVLMLCVAKVVFAKMTYEQVPYLTLVRVGINISLGTIGTLTLWLLVNKLIRKYPNIKIGRTDIWYGVYIYHQFIMMYLYYKTPIANYVGNILPVIGLFITIFLSYVLVAATLRTRVGRWLIG